MCFAIWKYKSYSWRPRTGFIHLQDYQSYSYPSRDHKELEQTCQFTQKHTCCDLFLDWCESLDNLGELKSIILVLPIHDHGIFFDLYSFPFISLNNVVVSVHILHMLC